jgi:hypothetical protein
MEKKRRRKQGHKNKEWNYLWADSIQGVRIQQGMMMLTRQ